MAYSVYYPSGCSTSVPDHYCDGCPVIEQGGIRSVAFIKEGFDFTDPTNPTQWQAGIASKDIIIIPNVFGDFDGGSPVEAQGYGDQATRLTGFNFQLTYNDPDYKNNADFYNAIKRSTVYRIAYRTQTLTHISENNVTVIPKNAVATELTSALGWNVLVKWSEGDLPVPYDTPAGIFTCYDYSGVIV